MRKLWLAAALCACSVDTVNMEADADVEAGPSSPPATQQEAAPSISCKGFDLVSINGRMIIVGDDCSAFVHPRDEVEEAINPVERHIKDRM